MKMLNELQKSVVIAYASNGMRVESVANQMHYHRNTIVYHLETITKKTGYDPRNFFNLIKLYEMATGKEIVMPKMTTKQAIAYLQPIADNAQLSGYQEALSIAMDAMREVEELREKLKKYENDPEYHMIMEE